jgi:DNA repair exonuclease SbcCD nuclease subunit
MKLAVICDTHYGARSDNLVFLDYTKQFLDKVFFPYIDEHKINHVIHLGDLVERRKYVNINTAARLRRDLLQELGVRQLNVDIIAGNHDVYYKDTNSVNALQELVGRGYPSFNIYTKATEIEIEGIKILLVPWINQENREETFKIIKKTKAQICFGHLDLNGFEMYRGVINRDGYDPGIFSKFDIVLTGHFHHKHSHSNIHYLGAPLQFNWSDYNDTKGFHVFDTETREVDFVENPFVIFKKIWYNDKDKTIGEVISDFNFDAFSGCFCKLIIEEKTNPYWFDIFVEKLEEAELSDLQIVEDHHHFDKMIDEDIISEAESTIEIFMK